MVTNSASGLTPTPSQTATRRRLQNYTEPSRAASATLHLCVTRAHIAHGRAAARAAGTSGFLPRERGQARRQEATQEGAPPGEGGAVCFVFRCCTAAASVVQLREVEPVEVTLASNPVAQLGKEARALHIRLLPAQRPLPDTLVGLCAMAGRASQAGSGWQPTSSLGRMRSPNGLIPRGSARRGGFSFSGVTGAASSCDPNGGVSATAVVVAHSPGSAMIVRA